MVEPGAQPAAAQDGPGSPPPNPQRPLDTTAGVRPHVAGGSTSDPRRWRAVGRLGATQVSHEPGAAFGRDSGPGGPAARMGGSTPGGPPTAAPARTGGSAVSSVSHVTTGGRWRSAPASTVRRRSKSTTTRCSAPPGTGCRSGSAAPAPGASAFRSAAPSPGTPNSARFGWSSFGAIAPMCLIGHYDDVRYEAHLALDWPEPPPVPEPESEAEVVGVDTSERLAWTDSRGEIWQNDGPSSCQCQKQHRTRCPYGLPVKLQREIGAKLGGHRRRRRASHRRRKLEGRRREVLRKRGADRDRAWNQQARSLLDRSPPVRLLAVQGLRPARQTRRGTDSAPGSSVSAQARRNRALAEAAPSRTITILQHQAERHGIPVAVIWARTRDVCGTCGIQNPESRKNQARFTCQGCGWSGDPAQNAALVLASRAHRQWVGSRANAEFAQGRETDPSGRRFGDGETHPTPDAARRGTGPPGSATGSESMGRSSTEASKLHPG